MSKFHSRACIFPLLVSHVISFLFFRLFIYIRANMKVQFQTQRADNTSKYTIFIPPFI